MHGVVDSPILFKDLGLSAELCATLAKVGYTAPTPIQSRAIPVLLTGCDLIGQAQTGTGKTAAFALPIVDRIKGRKGPPQALILTPTRELAIQVAEAFQSYAQGHNEVQTVCLYGGQSIFPQMKQLQRGPQVIVGTPGRIMDHLQRGTLDLESIRTVVLDEADEMLSMGFLEDLEAILQHTPEDKQTVLFSATMPDGIRRIAERYLRAPQQVVIEKIAKEAALIRQSHWVVSGMHKLDALTRILEAQDVEGLLIFVRTKTSTVELAEKLEARGYPAAALSGDLSQEARERTVRRLKSGALKIIVATDVAARGLDVDRISHVINYDAPFDVETYTHRIGRTGRAGRSGTAILFVSPREQGLLRAIERATGAVIPPYDMPTRRDVVARRIDALASKVASALTQSDLAAYAEVIDRIAEKTSAPPSRVAAALCAVMHADAPLIAPQEEEVAPRPARAPHRPSSNFKRKARYNGTGRYGNMRSFVDGDTPYKKRGKFEKKRPYREPRAPR